MEMEVVVDNISKRYGKVEALRGVSFAVKPGELFGLIGPDGAGKSTLFRILTTLLLADEGTATVGGADVVKDYKEIRRKVGYMPRWVFTLPGPDGGREPELFCYRFSHYNRRKL